MEYTEEYEIANVSFERPHVVLLGAGASLAAFPKGDRSGQQLPLLNNFVHVIGLESLMLEAGVSKPYDDFEEIYSRISLNPKLDNVRARIERAVYEYFEELKLPDEPSLYDYLVLSLRPKDVIATFNWDPFLWNALHRNRKFTPGPSVLFLHGSVAAGYCDKCKKIFSRSNRICRCGNALNDLPILFPVTKKDYNSDPAIAAHWRALQQALRDCWAFTILGYSAPKTDIEAIDLLKGGWGNVGDRNLEEIEIIDIKDEDCLRHSWDQFIHTHHYTVKDSFFDSWIAQHPRRSCEAIWAQNMEIMFIEPYPAPITGSFDELYPWFQPRIAAEQPR
jgi:hypothetical protein